MSKNKKQKTNEAAAQPSMSDIILDYAAPLLAGENIPPEAIQATLRFAMVCWNLPLMPADKAAAYRTNLLNSMPHDRGPQGALYWANTIEQMLARRRMLYPNDRRLLTNVELVNRKGHVDIQTDYQIAEPEPAAQKPA